MEAQVTNTKGKINIVLKNRQQEMEQLQHATIKRDIDPFRHIDQEFAAFIGLEKLKKTIKEIYANVHINQKREAAGLKQEKQVLHMLFEGNPGTGKTTVARKLAAVFHEMNVLDKGHFIEAERADLVGEYIGHTAQKTRALVQRAMGGILFIDEAYSLARGGEKDFGKEAIDTLVKHMEDASNRFILILAGYPREMANFMSLNPGLRSRFPIQLQFPDYKSEQLMDIAKGMLAEKEYQLTKEAEWKLKEIIVQQKSKRTPDFSNARFVRNILEKAIRMQAVRLVRHDHHLSTEELMKVTVADLNAEE
ncbi:stage V sporulation protein K [Terribacillus aidingensis]|uniref:Stage V sporulation protein K n=1 Tax=Terribacillus aidingensis TaxID=586416 RepID=A0A285NJW7_9BACI|nr:AAA family ATPase [Terribacillus aidingensis]SNZ09814.1 stage V sporulation protein K [Terribacillus aidingensis]